MKKNIVKKMKVLIISPHSDDEFLSCSSLFNENIDLKTITIYGNVYTKTSSRALPDEKGFRASVWSDPYLQHRTPENLKKFFPSLQTETLDFMSANFFDPIFVKTQYSYDPDEIVSLCKGGNDVFEYMKSNYFQNSYFLEGLKKLNEKKFDFNDFDAIIIPLGLGHIDHVIVRFYFEKIIDKSKLVFYSDKPYEKRKDGACLRRDAIKNFYSLNLPPLQHKLKILYYSYPYECQILCASSSSRNAIDSEESFYAYEEQILLSLENACKNRNFYDESVLKNLIKEIKQEQKNTTKSTL